VADNFEKYGAGTKLSLALLIGGLTMGDQIKALEKGVDVLIATPGRLMDLFGRGNILLTGCSMLVIDEADRMLDMGFIPDIEEICTKLPPQRQTLLFSATMPAPIKRLADKFLDNPKTIEVSRAASTNLNIKQFLVPVSSVAAKKRDALRQLLGQDEVRNAIIFCNRKTTVRELNKSLKQHGFKSGEIHGDMEQAQRIAELDLFKDGKINILVASDVAARGLDIKGVSHVFNFDAPWHPDDYVHRIGRTGRGGATGIAFTLMTAEDAENIQNIEKLTGQTIDRMELDGSTVADAPAATAPAEDAPRRGRRERNPREGRRERAPRESVAAPEPMVEAEAIPAAEPVATMPESRAPAERAPRAEPAFAPPPRRDVRRDERGDRRPRRDAIDDAPDDGWNGPMPDFLKATIGG